MAELCASMVELKNKRSSIRKDLEEGSKAHDGALQSKGPHKPGKDIAACWCSYVISPFMLYSDGKKDDVEAEELQELIYRDAALKTTIHNVAEFGSSLKSIQVPKLYLTHYLRMAPPPHLYTQFQCSIY